MDEDVSCGASSRAAVSPASSTGSSSNYGGYMGSYPSSSSSSASRVTTSQSSSMGAAASSSTPIKPASSSRGIGSGSGASEIAGMLRVEVLGAKNLHAAVLGSLLKWTPSYSNPFVVVSLHGEVFATTAKSATLNPSWKESGELLVPLPSEQELLASGQPVTTLMGSATAMPPQAASQHDPLGKLGGGKTVSAATTSGASQEQHAFRACHPEMLVQVFHRDDNTDATGAAAAGSATAAAPSSSSSSASLTPPSSSSSATDSPAHTANKLIGEVVVPLLPCLLSPASSHRAWYALHHDEHADAGQLQLALHYEGGGLEPCKHDIVRLTGFGGAAYYGKLLPANARLEVTETFQDQVVVQTRSRESWLLTFECHRNLVHVEHRPSLLRDAQTQLQTRIERVQHSSLAVKVHHVWQSVPVGPRRRLVGAYEWLRFSSGVATHVVSDSLATTLDKGVAAGMRRGLETGRYGVLQVSNELVRVYHATKPPVSTRRRAEKPTLLTRAQKRAQQQQEAMRRELEGGPLKGRGRIVHAFGEPVVMAWGDEEEEEKQEHVGEAAGSVWVVEEGDWEEEEDEDEEGGQEEAWKAACPEQLICPITGCPMLDPVVAADGHSYEREAIEHWFTTSNKSPMTGAPMPTTQVFANFTLRNLSDEFQQATATRMSKSKQKKKQMRKHKARHAAGREE